MRRAGIATGLGIGLIALAAPVVSAHQPATSFTAKSSAASPTEVLNVRAKAKHAAKGSTFSATAVVHFADGDVTIFMTNRGHSYNAGGGAVVPADQPEGTVGVDVTVTYNGVPQAPMHVDAKVRVDDSDTDDGDDSGDSGDTGD